MEQKNIKPLGKKAYGSTPHLIGSRKGPVDIGVHEGQHRICCEKTRDKHDRIIVTEKLDGSCCSIAKKDGRIYALTRAGYEAKTSPFEQHHIFSDWVDNGPYPGWKWDDFLNDGERVVGEWLAQAHGTRYNIDTIPFVVFSIIIGDKRLPWDEVYGRCDFSDIPTPRIIHDGRSPCSIEKVMDAIQVSGHGAIDKVEGAVWRVERKGEVDFLAKYVRHDKVDGCYLPEITGCDPVWNWRPETC